VTSVFGLTTSNKVQRLRECLTVVRAIRDDRTVDFHGSQLTAVDPSVLPVAFAGATPFSALRRLNGPRALRVTGELADDTLPINAGPRTIEGFIAPTITRAVDLAAIGPAETVTRRLKSYLDAAATDLARALAGRAG
jgi:alkanesulfonate monooxygenase SsuD/methylene tetrahydromethanopterin reductase-like flavin-dependent oxidoreductase (luciferase family)